MLGRGRLARSLVRPELGKQLRCGGLGGGEHGPPAGPQGLIRDPCPDALHVMLDGIVHAAPDVLIGGGAGDDARDECVLVLLAPLPCGMVLEDALGFTRLERGELEEHGDREAVDGQDLVVVEHVVDDSDAVERAGALAGGTADAVDAGEVFEHAAEFYEGGHGGLGWVCLGAVRRSRINLWPNPLRAISPRGSVAPGGAPVTPSFTN